MNNISTLSTSSTSTFSSMSQNIINKSLNICNNCGKTGHSFYSCKMPITSYGIILFRKYNGTLQYLMIRRKNSFGYIDFIRGKYSPYNIFQLQNIVDEMSLEEKEKIMTYSFYDLWKDMWGSANNLQYKNEEYSSLKKKEIITDCVCVDNKIITLKDIINNSKTNWIETEWEFPKGRRNLKEKDFICAIREFEEETGIPSSSIEVIENILPFEETFIGTNHKSYKHKYFIACAKKDTINLNNFQISEVSKIEWKTLDECLNIIRPYNLEKKNLIKNINNVLQEFRLYS